MIPASVLFGIAQLLSPRLTLWYQQIQLVATGRATELPAFFPLEEFVLSFAVGLVYGVSVLVAEVAVAWLAASTLTGNRPSTGAAIRYGLSKLASLVGISVFMSLMVFGVIAVGGALAVLPILASGGHIVGGLPFFITLVMAVATGAVVLFLTVRWYLATTVVALERRDAKESLRRSWHLVAKSTWRVLGYVIVFSLIIAVVEVAVTFVVSLVLVIVLLTRGSLLTSLANGPTVDPTVEGVLTFVTFLMQAVLMPILYIGMTLLYSDLRFRRGESALIPGGGEASLASLSEQ
jgi:hypothetical protein